MTTDGNEGSINSSQDTAEPETSAVPDEQQPVGDAEGLPSGTAGDTGPAEEEPDLEQSKRMTAGNEYP